MDLKVAERKYKHQAYLCIKEDKTDANGLQVRMEMTFEEWVQIWKDSGKWDLRGRTKGSYCMCRINDLGHYEVGNVFIDLHSNNVSSAQKGNTHKKGVSYQMSKETKQKISEANKGKNLSKETKQKMSEAHKVAVNTPRGQFSSIGGAAIELGIKRGKVAYRVNSTADKWKEWQKVFDN